MKLIILAAFISISLHLLLFNDYELKKKEIIKKETLKKEKKANVTFVKIKKEKKPVKKVVEKKQETIKKKIIKKKVVKKRPITKKVSKKLVKAPKKITYKKKRVIKKTNKKITKVPSQKKIKALENRTLEDFLSQKEPVDKKVLSQIERLYGREFETFTKVQKAFIKKNLNTFQQVTQRVLTRLGYPRLAASLRISGINIVQFTFHPNGNISNLRITDSSGYEILDKYTIKLIEIAYKDYPRPKTATKLKFNVQYRLY